jgi:ribose/xylose/arabinose/galactoside ABC-type transport system permease subunit
MNTHHVASTVKPVAGQLAILATVWVIFGIAYLGFFSDNNVFSILQGFAFLGMMALAVGVTMIAGELDLSVASVAAVAGVLSIQLLPLGILPALAITIALAAIFGAVQGLLITALGVNSIVFTIGTMFAMRGVAYVLSGEQTILVDTNDLDISDAILERFLVLSPFSATTLIALTVVGFVLAFTRWGREIYAIGGGRPESKAAGVRQRRPVVMAFMLSASLASLAGAMASISSGSGAPFAFSSILLQAVTAALVGGIGLYGGKGTAFNVALGALILQSFLSGLSGQGVPQATQQLAMGLLLLVVIAIEFAASPSASSWLATRGGLPFRTRPASATRASAD